MCNLETNENNQSTWVVYILECSGNKLYTGITNDLESRYEKHKNGTGAKFTKSHPPEKILATLSVSSRSEALKMEYGIKQMTRKQKIAFIKKSRLQ